MKEIIFWFSSHRIMNYWLNYAINYCKDLGFKIEYNKVENWIKFFKLKILFRADTCEQYLVGQWDKNQYWVEDLFDNEFKEFFFTIIFENKPFIEMSDILEEDING